MTGYRQLYASMCAHIYMAIKISSKGGINVAFILFLLVFIHYIGLGK